MKPKKEMKKRRLDEGLCPEDFEICVPESCQLLSDGKKWSDWSNWHEYVEGLTTTGELPVGYTEETAKCWTCDCKPGWKLTGEVAVAHACAVHERIYRQALSLDLVSAIDVGFAIQERQKEFANFLAIRIHVRRKRAPEELVREGLASFTDSSRVLGSLVIGRDGELRPDGAPPFYPDPPEGGCGNKADDSKDRCPRPDRAAHLQQLLRRELRDRTRFLRRLSSRYPISGIGLEDLSVFCPLPLADTETLGDIRLCICGVPIDVINAQYNPSIHHPGGDAASGVFVEPPQRTDQMSNDEQILIGRGRVNPLVGGASIGSVTGQAGTLGAVVWDRTDGTPCVLSNWHVLASTADARVGQPSYQPALFDGGTRDDVVARLKRWHLGENGDSAIAELTGSRHYASGEVLGLWHPCSESLPPKLGLEVRKWGRTTGFTKGFIDGIHLAINIDYGGGVVRSFKNQFHIAPLYLGQQFSQVGDSGSLVVTRFRPVDLHEKLTTVVRWIRDVYGPGSLCDRVEEKYISWSAKEETWEEPQSPCFQTWKILESFKCEKDNLCESAEDRSDDQRCRKECRSSYLKREEWKQELDASWEELEPKIHKIRTDTANFSRLEERLEELLRKHCEKKRRRHDVDEDLAALKRALEGCAPPKALEGCAPMGDADEDGEKQDELENTSCEWTHYDWESARLAVIEDIGEKLGKEKLDNEELCDWLESILLCVEKRRRLFEECSQFCEDIEKAFSAWKDMVADRDPSHDEICAALYEATKDSHCKRPVDIIEEVEKALQQDNSGPSSTTEAGNTALKSLEGLFGCSLEEIKETIADALDRFGTAKEDQEDRDRVRAYYAVGMIFAGDTPGSPFGEFAVASDISRLAEELRFSLRPVFEPRSSFRELRTRPPGGGDSGRGARRSRRGLTPRGTTDDPRGGGPQPDLEPAGGDSGN